MPEISFRCSYWLQSEIIGNRGDFDALERFTEEFGRYFQGYSADVLKWIEKYTGFGWPEGLSSINVWIFDGYQPSVSYPLLLNCHSFDKMMTLHALVHELAHVLTFPILEVAHPSPHFVAREMEAIAEIVAKKVSIRIFGAEAVQRMYEKDVVAGTAYKFVLDRMKNLESKWDLEKMPLSKWFGGNKIYRVRNYVQVDKAEDT